MSVTPAFYAHITQKLMNITNSKVVAILEVHFEYFILNLISNILNIFREVTI